jgi:hypothetical protein
VLRRARRRRRAARGGRGRAGPSPRRRARAPAARRRQAPADRGVVPQPGRVHGDERARSGARVQPLRARPGARRRAARRLGRRRDGRRLRRLPGRRRPRAAAPPERSRGRSRRRRCGRSRRRRCSTAPAPRRCWAPSRRCGRSRQAWSCGSRVRDRRRGRGPARRRRRRSRGGDGLAQLLDTLDELDVNGRDAVGATARPEACRPSRRGRPSGCGGPAASFDGYSPRASCSAGLEGEAAARERLGELRTVRDAARERYEQIGGTQAAVRINAADDRGRLSREDRRALIRATVERALVKPGPWGLACLCRVLRRVAAELREGGFGAALSLRSVGRGSHRASHASLLSRRTP